jgi:ligand-binding sensor domain-containing protein/signal transduction histidine kinase
MNRHVTATRIGTVAAICAAVICAAANDFVVEVWDVDAGLPHGSVRSIAQTPDGYLWIGTERGGLARFDGARFVTYHIGNTPDFASMEIHKLLVDHQGTLWVGTVEGALFSLRDGRFRVEYQNFQTPGSWLETLVSSSDDEVVFSTTHGWILHGRRQGDGYQWRESKPAIPYMLYNPRADRDGTIWFRTRDGRLGQVQNGNFLAIEDPPGLAGPAVGTLEIGHDGRLWVGQGSTLHLLGDDGRFVGMTPTGGPQTGTVHAVAAAPDKALWVRMGNMLRKCDTERNWLSPAGSVVGPASEKRGPLGIFPDSGGGVWAPFPGHGLWHVASNGRVQHLDERHGLPGRMVQCCFEDREQNMWFGFRNGGLARIRPRVFHTLPLPDGQSPPAMQSVCEDSHGTIWGGSSDGALHRWQNDTFDRFVPPGLEAPGIEVIAFPDPAGRLWVGATHCGVLAMDQDTFSRPFQSDKFGCVARALLVDSSGSLWIGNEFGLSRWHHDELKCFTLDDGFAPAYVVSLAQDPTGAIWIGTGHGELRRFRDGRFDSYRPDDSPTAAAAQRAAAGADPFQSVSRGALSAGEAFRALHVDERGVVWIGALGGGLLRFENKTFFRFTTRSGLPDDSVNQILEDDQGHFWLGSIRGITRVSRAALDELARGSARRAAFATWNRSDGLPTVECSGGGQPASWRGRDGRLWFATTRGVVWVDPAKLPHNPLPPPVVVESVRVGDRKIDASATLLRIPPGRHHIEFHFTALSFTDPAKVRFQWRLVGMENDWQEESPLRQTTYNYLPPGEYQFQVRACNNDGVWNETAASLAITLLPFFWQTGWFKAGTTTAGLLLASGLVLAVQRRRYRTRMRLLEQQSAIERDRFRIARDIHDHLGAQLTKASKLTERLGDHPAPGDSYAPVLRALAETNREMVRAMDEIVWAVSPHNDTLEAAANYLVHFTEEFLGKTGVTCELDVPLILPAREIPSEVRHNLFMAVQEALNNAVKHSRSPQVRLRMALVDDHLTVSVEDDGVGFHPGSGTAPNHCNGLDNMSKRMEAVGGLVRLASQPGHGTALRFTVPLPPISPTRHGACEGSRA